MAGNPVAIVKANLAAALRPLMPLQTGSSDPVPVLYSYPGDDNAGRELVWFHGADTSYEIHSLRAGRRRRVLTVRFDVVAQVLLEGATVESGTDAPQQVADARADELAQVVDEYIADEEHAASPALVDVAWVESSKTEYGVHDHGSWSRVILRVAFTARVL
jgi:hypothetical protein